MRRIVEVSVAAEGIEVGQDVVEVDRDVCDPPSRSVPAAMAKRSATMRNAVRRVHARAFGLDLRPARIDSRGIDDRLLDRLEQKISQR